ncbi:TPA: hypothetical protein ACJ569_003549 [Kluyvera cryocrescens]
MSIYAIVTDGKVVNTIEWDGTSEYKPETGELVVIPEEVSTGVGWTYDGGDFIPPPGFITSEQPEE